MGVPACNRLPSVSKLLVYSSLTLGTLAFWRSERCLLRPLTSLGDVDGGSYYCRFPVCAGF